MVLRHGSFERPAVIFLHIPKTAGTTLRLILYRQYSPEQIYSVAEDPYGGIDALKRLTADRRRGIRLLEGHMPYGLHELLPQPAVYVTLLRDPIERTLSLYYHVTRDPDHYFHDLVASKGLGVADMLRGKWLHDLDNGQTRLLSGVWNDVPVGECTPEMLAMAKANWASEAVLVGLSERFNEALIYFRRALRWYYVYYVPTNVTAKRPGRQDLTPEELRIVEQHNQLDQELYRFAAGLFRRNVRRQSLAYQLDLNLFRAFNRLLATFTIRPPQTTLGAWLHRRLATIAPR